ncbi:MAG: nickel pincer cofactor biosynthesis protein LarC [Ruminococcus sp.]|nr:nickel pincer cofactor biosynthesis protein LarC [Ruminococcus sp.]
MKILYIECNMGAAGDMLMAALSELLPEPDIFSDKVSSLNLPGVAINRHSAQSCGISGTHISVTVNGEEEESCDDNKTIHHHHKTEHHHHEHDHKTIHHSELNSEIAHHHEHENDHVHHHHEHRSLADIKRIIDTQPVPEKVRRDAFEVYSIIAQAESQAHGKPVDEVHFHEVGAMDAVADVLVVCLLMNEIKPDKVVVSPVCTGFGQVRCAHGIMPVPAPATAAILRGIPAYSGSIRGELCTPTGAALLKYFADEFGEMPLLRTSSIGVGIGTKEFPAANCVRAFLGETSGNSDLVTELCCEMDDITGEQLAFAQEMIFAAGALDVYTTAVNMKKNRPGILLTCLCHESDREAVLRAIFRHTTTIGVRENLCRRYVLERREVLRDTPYGQVRFKEVSGYGVHRQKPESDDICRIARENDMCINDITNKED